MLARTIATDDLKSSPLVAPPTSSISNAAEITDVPPRNARVSTATTSAFLSSPADDVHDHVEDDDEDDDDAASAVVFSILCRSSFLSGCTGCFTGGQGFGSSSEQRTVLRGPHDIRND